MLPTPQWDPRVRRARTGRTAGMGPMGGTGRPARTGTASSRPLMIRMRWCADEMAHLPQSPTRARRPRPRLLPTDAVSDTHRPLWPTGWRGLSSCQGNADGP